MTRAVPATQASDQAVVTVPRVTDELLATSSADARLPSYPLLSLGCLLEAIVIRMSCAGVSLVVCPGSLRDALPCFFARHTGFARDAVVS